MKIEKFDMAAMIAGHEVHNSFYVLTATEAGTQLCGLFRRYFSNLIVLPETTKSTDDSDGWRQRCIVAHNQVSRPLQLIDELLQSDPFGRLCF